MKQTPTLDEIRARIDDIDEQLVRLIGQRAALAHQVGQLKQDSSGDEGFYRPEREARVLRRVAQLNEKQLPDEEMVRLFREIISACLALEQRLNIAYLGPEGTFTEAAAWKHFGHSVQTTALGAIDQVFREVESGACQYGVVPIENSIEGVVNHTLDMLINSPLRICGEVELRIHQHLLARGADIAAVTRVYSHRQSLAQCRAWLDQHLVGVERIAVDSNAEAARRAASEPNAAAVAGESAAEHYGLQMLARNIEDEPDNTTRFLVLGRHATPPSGRDKTSLLFSTANRPGALYSMLKCFSDNDVSLTRIESRPSRRGMWDYLFFVDLEGHGDDPDVAAAIRQLEHEASMVKLLGSYPSAVL